MLDPAVARSVDELRGEFWDERAKRRRWLAIAQDLLDRDRLADAQAAFRRIVEHAPTWAEGWSGLAATLFRDGQDAAALDAAVHALDLDPRAATPVHLIGRIRRSHSLAVSTERIEAACRHVLDRAREDMNLSERLPEHVPLADLIAAVERELSSRVDTHRALACLQLGNLRMLEGDGLTASEHYSNAYRAGASHAQAAANVAVACTLANQPSRALAWRGLALRAEHDDEAAIAVLARVVDGEEAVPFIALALGDSQARLNRHDDALATWHRALARWPSESSLHARVANLLQVLGRTGDAMRAVRRGIACCPADAELRLIRLLMLPAIYDRENQIAGWRRHYERGLRQLTGEAGVSALPPEALFEAIGRRSNFYLPYQGRNDRDLQIAYGTWVASVARRAHAHSSDAPPPSGDAVNRRIRVGYVSAHFRQHTVARLFGGWIVHANRARFEIRVYHLGETMDALTEELRQAADLFRHLDGSVDVTAAAIARDRSDILVYLDIGMHAAATCLAALRLAPVQCAAWGHPTTTGLPTIDYFLSSDAMEPDDAEAWYSESLVRLPRTGVTCARVDHAPAPADRRVLGLRSDAMVYLCGQSPLKYLPQHDHLLVEIARRVPHAQFVFSATHPAAGRLIARLARAFEHAGLDVQAIRLLPELGWSEFLGVVAASDVVLDTVDWSGGQTMLEVLSIALPIVTWPRGGMRGRHAAGMLSVLGITETIAHTSSEYVSIAVRLGLEPAWRADIAHRTRMARSRLFDDREALRALERFYVDAFARAPADAV